MPKKTETKRAAKSQPHAALPDWLTETPIETEYTLIMHEGGVDCDRCQSIELSRHEFLMIKVYLARLRGAAVPKTAPNTFKSSRRALPSIWDELSPEEISAVPEAFHA